MQDAPFLLPPWKQHRVCASHQAGCGVGEACQAAAATSLYAPRLGAASPRLRSKRVPSIGHPSKEFSGLERIRNLV